jgi:hypothetical protein
LNLQGHDMPDSPWTPAEKRIARRVFEAALQRELAETLAEFKRRAAQATQAQDMWSVEGFLAQARRAIDAKYDYRYSQLVLVFGRLLREGRISEQDLNGLSEDKVSTMRTIASL